MMNKKILIIIGIAGGAIAVGIFAYLLIGTGDESAESEGTFSLLFPESAETETPGLPESKEAVSDLSGTKQTGESAKTRFAQLINIPVAGATFNYDSNKIRYVEKSTGHIYEINEEGKEQKSISATTIPKIFEAIYSHHAKSAILRYFENGNSLKTFLAYNISTTTEGVFLPLNTSAVAVSPSEEKIFYLIKSGGVKGVLSSFENKNAKEIFSFPVGDFLIEWPEKNTITLLSKPTAFFDGYFYKFNVQTKSFEKILGNLKGLTAKLSPNGKLAVYSEYISNSVVSKIYNIEKKRLGELGIATLAEKCVFSKTNSDIIYCAAPETLPPAYYPDDWYKGLISFSDGFWKIDAREGSKKFISSNENIDAVNLFLNKTESKLFFTNKKDSSLWSLEL